MTEQTFEKAARNWHDGKMKRQHWKHTESL